MVSSLALRPALSEASKHILVKVRDVRVDSATDLVLQFYKPDSRMQITVQPICRVI